MSDPCVMGGFRMGYVRMGVVTPLFEQWKAQGVTEEITLVRMKLAASSDLYTQHPNITETEVTIDAVVRLGPAGREDLDVGALGPLDGVIYTADGVKMMNQVKYQGNYFEVDRRPIEVREPNGSFLHRKCALKLVEFRR